MIFDKDGNITIVFQEKTSLQTFLKNLNDAYSKLKNENIIVNLFSFSSLNANDILEFLELSNEHQRNRKSFVLVTDKVSYEDIPDEINLVPTIQEAKDLIEMEEIERDLDL